MLFCYTHTFVLCPAAIRKKLPLAGDENECKNSPKGITQIESINWRSPSDWVPVPELSELWVSHRKGS